jgi:hypothetical protein
MWDWCDKLKLNTSSSALVKRDIRSLPQTNAEFEADFFFDQKYSTKRQERWVGSVIQREDGAVLAVEEVPLPPPTVNSLANLLAHAMLRPRFGDRQRPRIIYLRDRPQWQAKNTELNITDWSCVVLSLCAAKGDKQWSHKHLLRLATRIANQLAEALGIDGPRR